MPRKKTNKGKGRPPKYVVDKKGREIVGLSHNKANNQYYLTFSNPREYLGSSKKKAIEAYYQRKVDDQLSQEAQQEQQHKDDIYRKALELLKYDESIQELIQDKARVEIQKILLETGYLGDYYRFFEVKNHFKEEISEIKELIVSAFIRKMKRSLTSEITIDFLESSLSRIINRYLTHHQFSNKELSTKIAKTFEHNFKEQAEREYKEFSDYHAWKVVEEQIKTDPVAASHKMWAKELAYLKMFPGDENDNSPFKVRMPLPWWLAWDIYDEYKYRKTQYNYKSFWNCIGAYIGYFDSIDQVSKEQLLGAIRFSDGIHWGYTSVGSMESIAEQYDQNTWKIIQKRIGDIKSVHFYPTGFDVPRVLKTIAETIYYKGFGQALHIIKLIDQLPNK